MASDLILSLREVDVRFGKKQIFHNLDLNIHRGDLIALVGKNGIGKTTLMKIIEGSQDLDNGEVWQYPGLNVSYFSQQFDVQDDNTIESELDSILQSEKEKYKIDIYCDNLNLTKSSSIKNLSGGQKRRVALIKSLIPESDILLLDEPTNHFDLECIMWLENHLRDHDLTLTTGNIILGGTALSLHKVQSGDRIKVKINGKIAVQCNIAPSTN